MCSNSLSPPAPWNTLIVAHSAMYTFFVFIKRTSSHLCKKRDIRLTRLLGGKTTTSIVYCDAPDFDVDDYCIFLGFQNLVIANIDIPTSYNNWLNL